MGLGRTHDLGRLSDKAFGVAVAFMVVAAAFNAVDTLLVRVISTEMSAFSIAFFRSVFGLVFVAPWIVRRRAYIARTNYVWLHLVRAALKVLALAAFFFAISRGNLAQITAIAFTTPIFVTTGAALILGEKLGAASMLSVLMGFGGVLLIVRPVVGRLRPLSAFRAGGGSADGRHAAGAEGHGRKGFDRYPRRLEPRAMVPLALLPALFFWTTPSPLMLGLLAIQGALGALAMTAITRAVSLADVSAVIPFDFLRLPLVAFGAYYFFGQSADVATWIGAAVIFLAGVLASRRLDRAARRVPAGGRALPAMRRPNSPKRSRSRKGGRSPEEGLTQLIH